MLTTKLPHLFDTGMVIIVGGVEGEKNLLACILCSYLYTILLQTRGFNVVFEKSFYKTTVR